MFQSYTDGAKRVVFYSRYEAAMGGRPTIGTEHLLLGLIRDARGLAFHILTRHRISMETIRKELDQRSVAESVEDRAEIPFSDECSNALEIAARESEAFGHDAIGPEHILLGILNDTRTSGASLLHRMGLRLEDVRAEVAELSGNPGAWERVPLEALLRDYDREPSRWKALEESDHSEIGELREQLRILALAMDAAIERSDYESAVMHREHHLAAEIRLRQLLE